MTSIRDINSGKIKPGAVTIQGWVRTHRQSKSVSFIELNDGSGVKGLQLVIEPALESYVKVAAGISTGAAVKASGELVDSPAKGQKFELKVSEIELIGQADPETYPLQKKGHSLEFLREILHLRPRSNTIGAVWRLRSRAAMAVHRFYQDRDFVYLNTPILTTSDCEGAGEMFRVSTLDPKSPPLLENGKIDFGKDFFGEQAHLTVSGQLEGEIGAMALSKVYTFGPTFRAENSNTTRHLSEFWMIEPEVAFNELPQNMELAWDFVKYVISDVIDKCGEELEFLHAREWCEKGLMESLQKLLSSSYTVLDYTEAIKVLEKSGKKFEYPVSWGIDLQTEHERFLTDEYVKGPVFVINYPKDIKAFYMKLNDDKKTVRAMDLLVPRLGEIIGGSQREENHDVLLNRIKEMGLPEEPYWWYLELRKFGTAPHAGFGLGFERLLMYVSGMQNIRDVAPFPRFPGYAKF